MRRLLKCGLYGVASTFARGLCPALRRSMRVQRHCRYAANTVMVVRDQSYSTRRENRSAGRMHKNSGIVFTIPNLRCWLLIISIVAILSPAVAGEEAGPVEMLQGLTKQLIAIADSRPEVLDDPAELRKIAIENVLPHVDFLMFSRRVLGKSWRAATVAQRDFFVSEFQELLLGTYLRSVSSYKDNSIRYLPVRGEGQEKRVLVNAIVERKGGPPVHAAFRLHRAENEWLIYDVIVEGISLVATHRSTFAQIIHNYGIDGLIERLREKNKQNSAGQAAVTR